MTDLHINIENTLVNSSFGLILDGSDIKTDTGLRSAVIYALFTDRLADADERLPGDSLDRRGHWADTWRDADRESTGSLLWLLSDAKETQETLLRARDYAREALQYLVNSGVARSVAVSTRWVRSGVLGITVEMPLVDGGRFAEELPYLLEVS